MSTLANNSPNLAELIYLVELTSLYTDLPKANDDDLRELARHSIRAAKIFQDVCNNRNDIAVPVPDSL